MVDGQADVSREGNKLSQVGVKTWNGRSGGARGEYRAPHLISSYPTLSHFISSHPIPSYLIHVVHTVDSF